VEENVTTMESSNPSPVAEPDRGGAARALPGPLDLHVQPRDDCVIVGVRGELRADNVGELTRRVSALVREGWNCVVLDASRLYDLDAVALAELGRIHGALAAQADGLRLAAPRPWVRRLLEYMCRRGTFAVHPTVAEAIEHLGASCGTPGVGNDS
jgi:anti-anti-sigma regulatory factor